MLGNRKTPTVGKIAIAFLFALLLAQELAPSITAGRMYPATLLGGIVLIAAWQYHRKQMSGIAVVIVVILAGWLEILFFVRYLRTSIAMLALQIVLLGILFIWAAARTH